jgi:heptosyltransferase-3
VPCLFEGCDRHLDSVSRCLQDITAEQVIETARSLLADSQPV